MKQMKVSGWVFVLALVLCAVWAGAISFTDVDNAQYWGKTGIPALTKTLDANFALIEAGYSGPVAATTLSASGATTLSGSVTVIGGGVTSRWDNAAGLIDATKLGGNIAVARIAEALKAPGAIGGTTPAAGTFTGVTVGKASVASGVVTLAGTTSGTATLTVADDGSTVTVNKPVLAAVNGTVGATTPAAGSFTTVAASGASTLSGAVTVIGGGVTSRWDNAAGLIDDAAIEARTEWIVDGKYSVVGGDASTGLMILKGAVTSGTNATETVTFGTVFGAAPIVTCTYTEDPGDVRPIFVTSVTASNFVANITADMNFGYIAVGTRP